MYEVYQQVLEYIRATWRRRWYAISIAWLVAGGGWIAVASLPDSFESSARIYVDMDTMLAPLMRGLAVETNLYHQIDIMQRTLLSRPNLEKVMLMTDMDLKVQNEQEKEALMDRLRDGIHVRQQGPNLFQVAFTDTDPAATKRVVQAVLNIFVESNLGANRKDMDATRRFLEDQIRDAERSLEEMEARIAEFKRKNMGFVTSGEGGYYNRLQTLRADVAASEQKIKDALAVRDELKAQLAAIPQYIEVPGGSDGPIGVSSGPETGLQADIFKLEQARDQLLLRYTEQYPDVVTIDNRLKDMRARLKAMQEQTPAAGPAGAAPDGGLAPGKKGQLNPVFEQVQLQLVQHEAAIKAMERRLEGQTASVEEWQKMANLVPQIEAEQKQLTRDYDLKRKQYHEFRARLESANLARDLETKAQKVQFRVIDPPRVPVKPSGPNRTAFFVAVLLAGVVGGAAVAFLLGQLNTTFPSVQRLRRSFALPVLGSVTAIVSGRERRSRRRETLGFTFVSGGLAVAFLGLIAIEKFGRSEIVESVRGLGII